MKRICFVIIIFFLVALPKAPGQDAATEERLNKLTGQMEDLISAQKLLKDRLSALSKELEAVREQASKPTGNYAAQEDLKSLAEKVKEVDRNRHEDYDKIKAELLKLGDALKMPPPSNKKSRSSSPAPEPTEKAASAEKGFEYTIAEKDTLNSIVKAYREKNIKVTTDQIIKANPGLKANQLRVGQKIFIPAPGNSKSDE